MGRRFDVVSSLLASVNQQGRGVNIGAANRQPAEPLELYDMEGCPFCRLVREALTELDLDVMIYPCPKGGLRYRPLVERLGGKQQFPFLMDPNTDAAMYESADIIDYLYKTYGKGRAPASQIKKLVRTASSVSASIVRPQKGLHASDNVPPKKPLELYSFEGSPFARLVRERLTELEIPYLVRQCGRNQLSDWLLPFMRESLDYAPSQRNRAALFEKTGKVAIPYLVDPNNGTELYESDVIVNYLDQAYGALAEQH